MTQRSSRNRLEMERGRQIRLKRMEMREIRVQAIRVKAIQTKAMSRLPEQSVRMFFSSLQR